MDGLVWTKERRAPRRQAPSVERFVAHAVAVADAEGADAVTMRRVAKDLGSGTASLYRYVASRDELLDLMIDAVQGEDVPPGPSGDWRADLSASARRLRALLVRHPWLGAELTGRPALGPNALRQYDAVLAAAAQLTSDATLAALAVDTVTAYVLGAAGGEVAEAQASRRTGMTESEWRASVGPYIREVVESGDYPHFARRVVEADDLSPKAAFEIGLACVLDGLATRIPKTPTSANP
ncbi:TetR/AcrR family transcriptional regulator C-terminal domain-containing protein [Actinomadura rupiterrae]|uniref:TetR/AcrR family transcriptional regulator C-terminal domain-containing protein n=1 Tax=Actinomadura rupiterrae TaxID=559627 RepID=UPI0020A4B956|nr:TetR/AcrR family transcriptional regulator C-terminal domain-containing protein [Actinomadura rupiterrae]MCP2336611.1 AcrR family transcriptional regulator [Actinomadura rupiterrae]